MTQRTTAPPSPSYFVCRACRAVSMVPMDTPFCGTECAATWAYWQTGCDASLLKRYVAEECADWLAERHALAMEAH